MILWFTLSNALAHGPPLAPLRIASHDMDSPVHVTLTEGMLYPDAEGWRFLCPALWGGTPEAPVGRSWDGTARIHGAFDLYRISPEGEIEAAGVPELSAASVLAVTANEEASWALVRETSLDALWRVDPPLRLAGLPHRGLSIAVHQDELRVGMLTAEGQIALARYDAETGAQLETFLWDHEGGWTPSVRSDGTDAWVVLRQSGAARLHAWGDAPEFPVLTSSTDILGPVNAQGHTYLTVDGTLHTLSPKGAQPTDLASPAQCLERHHDQLYVCTDGALIEISKMGGPPTPLFDMERILPPDPSLIPEELADPCAAEWLRALSDLGRMPTGDTGDTGEPSTTGPAPKSGGCGGHRAGLFLIPLLLLTRWRTR